MRATYQICVSGASKGNSVEMGKELAYQLGEAIAKAGHSLLTGATTGLPEYAAAGYKKADGIASLGISPAATKAEHVLKYRLPTDDFDAILYTGYNYVGRDALLVTSADAVVSIGGRMGTLHEFTIAMETRTPLGLLQGAGGVSEQIEELIKILPNAHPDLVVIDEDPERLIKKLTALLNKENGHYRNIYSS